MEADRILLAAAAEAVRTVAVEGGTGPVAARRTGAVDVAAEAADTLAEDTDYAMAGHHAGASVVADSPGYTGLAVGILAAGVGSPAGGLARARHVPGADIVPGGNEEEDIALEEGIAGILLYNRHD